MNKFFYYIILPFVLYVILVGLMTCQVYKDLKSAIEGSAVIVQSLAIIIGGLWAYHKFGWEKKCENIITLKSALMEYTYKHSLSAAKFHKDKDVDGYKIRLLTAYNELNKKIHLSYYVSVKLRKKIFDAIWLTIGNTGKNYKEIVENWENFGKQLKEIYDEFDKIISL